MKEIIMYEIVIRNGYIYDGLGSNPYVADIAISNGIIVAIGRIEEEALSVIDASGFSVSPGFIDLHTHSDLSFLIDPLADSKLRQGCTFELIGNCGRSDGGPLFGEGFDLTNERLETLNFTPKFSLSGNYGDYLNILEENGTLINIAGQIGHGTLRTSVIGSGDINPTLEELDNMISLLDECLDQGALGFSTGLYYAPGNYSRTEEIIKLCNVASKKNKLYSTHMRDESDYSIGLRGALEETMSIAQISGVKTQVSHLKCIGPVTWGQADTLLSRIDEMRRDGYDVIADQYPYTGSSTMLAGAVFPRWVQAGGRSEALQRIEDPNLYDRLKKDISRNFYRRGGAAAISIAQCPDNREFDGLNLEEISDVMNCDPEDAAITLYRGGTVHVIAHSLKQDDVDKIACHPYVCVGSDGSSIRTEGALSVGSPHPRSYGTFPRFIKQYVREKKMLSMQEAIRKMTSLPASRLDLKRRGSLQVNNWADIVIFDSESIDDKSTFANPHQYSVGIKSVLVNGCLAYNENIVNTEHHGKIIRDNND
ncbi:MAG: D-aminoacylase [SAR202 cluster bacterium]|nr:aminoacylase [Chloroflexota bacterium]MQG50494.1 D-aminoacylase [SAR202 cluster bacterium]